MAITLYNLEVCLPTILDPMNEVMVEEICSRVLVNLVNGLRLNPEQVES
jgi:hypothetical protein